MSQLVATRQLAFDDFKKDEYRAFQLEGESLCISLPTMLDRLKDVLMDLERQMKQGDHLAITLTVRRPLDTSFEDEVTSVIHRYNRSIYGSPYGASHP